MESLLIEWNKSTKKDLRRIALLGLLAVSACRSEKPKPEKLIQPEQQEVIRQIEKTYRK